MSSKAWLGLALAYVGLAAAQTTATPVDTELRWGPHPEQRVQRSERKVYPYLDPASGEQRFTLTPPKSSTQGKNDSAASTVYQDARGQIKVPNGKILVEIDPTRVESIEQLLTQRGWTVTRHAVKRYLVVESRSLNTVIDDTRELAQLAGVVRADPSFWQNLNHR